MLGDAYAKRSRDGVCRDIVMGRADATGGEDVSVLGPQLIDGCHDLFLHIGDGARLAHGNAEGLKILRDLLQVDVARAAGEKLIPDQA